LLILVEDVNYKIVVFDEIHVVFHLHINYCYCLLQFLNMGLYCFVILPYSSRCLSLKS